MSTRLRRADLAALLDASPAMLVVVDADGTVVYANDALRSFLGSDLAPGESLLERTHPDDVSSLRDVVSAADKAREKSRTLTLRVRGQDGTWRSCEATAAGHFGKPGGVGLFCVPVSGAGSVQRHDDLTQLPNRAAFIERLARSLGRARQRPDYNFAVLALDLDRFSLINNALGDTGGDQVLRKTAGRLRDCVRPADMVARVGADQFAIIADHLAPDTDPALDATRVAERIQDALPEVDQTARNLLIGATRVAVRIQQQALASPFELDAHEVFATASIGIAPSAAAYASAEEMFRDADLAMHRAKAAGGARYELFDRRMHARISERLQLESDLRRAFDRGQFRLHYQPIVRLDDLSVCGFECLLRWEHPERGLLQPADFLRVAEEMGVLVRLSAWLVREACSQIGSWRRTDGPRRSLSVSVNLASGAFESADLLTHVGEALAGAGSGSGQLALELTEGALVSNFEATRSTLEALKALGVDVNVDDFGTGYSSLSYIHRLPIAAIKIDQSFTQRVGQDPGAERMIRTIVELGHSLNRTVIAEGIETREQLECLRSLNCDRGQGFLFSPPVDATDAGALLDRASWLSD